MTGPLHGTRILELAGQGPAPFACMLLADLGAEVVTVRRLGAPQLPEDSHARGRRSIALDLKDKRAADLVMDLVATSDAFVEGFRPGVAERLGVGPEPCLRRNPRLVYGRMTGWGQDGPLSQAAGHDVNYLALSGALHSIGEAGGAPVVPLNLVGDYGAGGMLLALGVVAALLETRASGQGQVVDAAIVDGLAAMLAPFHASAARGTWRERGTNLLDGGAHFYGIYRTADERWVAVGAIEPPFYQCLLELIGVEPSDLGEQMDRASWDAARARLAAALASRTRDEWVAHFEGHDACFQPVLDLAEAREHPHAVAREMFVEKDGVPHQTPAPRFSRTALDLPASVPPGDADAVLAELGLAADEIAELRSTGVLS
jgi:alpha-methylacyl-CoA racemase